MNLTSRQLSALYRDSHDQMRNIDGLQPQEAFDELLKYLFLKENADETKYRFPSFSIPTFNQNVVSLNRGLAKELRSKFRKFLKETNSWSSELWQDKSLRLSDTALLGVHELLEKVDFSVIGIDTRSAALNEFIPSELRRGLGVFPTPDGVAQMMVEIASPSVTSRVLDPACGTGTFLVEVVRLWNSNSSKGKKGRVWGIDKSARMLLLSELNLGHNKNIKYRRALADSLYQTPTSLFEELNGGFDFILTNPPFGVIIDRNKHNMTLFQTCRNGKGDIVKRQQSEIVFVEQCLKYLKPGGLLGIVLPRSMVTNSSLKDARLVINSFGYLEALVNLPPETFCMSGTQTNTIVLFVRRYKSSSEKAESVSAVCVTVDNVGFDSTGRPRNGNQLKDIAKIVHNGMKGKIAANCAYLLPKVSKSLSISRLPELLSGRMLASGKQKGLVLLGELVETASNGRTPGRANYSSEGLFVTKVGNLTGQGINWEPRDRNFVSGAEVDNRKKNARLMLKKNDIVLTSSAHSPVYIAKKVDIVVSIPRWIGEEASYVGEVMMIRARKDVDPYVLVAYLRLPSTKKQIQSMVRGQTAHLHPKDLLDMRVPSALTKPPLEIRRLAERIRKESQFSEEMNKLAFEQRKSYGAVENALSS